MGDQRPRITGRWRRPSEWLAPVWEREPDGARVHVGGVVMTPDGVRYPLARWTDSQDPLWLLARAVEPKQRRALMLYADLLDTCKRAEVPR